MATRSRGTRSEVVLGVLDSTSSRRSPRLERRRKVLVPGEGSFFANWTAVLRMHLLDEVGKGYFDEVALVFRKPGLPTISDEDGWMEVPNSRSSIVKRS